MMSWFGKQTKGPGDTLLADWDEHVFDPLPDITAYELALFIKAFMRMGSIYGVSEYVFVYRPNPTQNFSEWIEIKRHFRPTGNTAHDVENAA